jgi:hypothetical protein
MLGIGRGAVLEEVEAEAAPALERIEEAMRGQPGQRVGLADERLDDALTCCQVFGTSVPPMPPGPK